MSKIIFVEKKTAIKITTMPKIKYVNSVFMFYCIIIALPLFNWVYEDYIIH